MSSPAEGIEIRRMSAADVPRVIEIASGLEHAPLYPRSTWMEVVDPKSVPPRLALVAGGPSRELCGFAVASLLPPQAELETIAVAAASQRRGIGRRLIQSLFQDLRRAGIQEVWLEVRVSNAPAIALYRGLRFRETGHRTSYYAHPVEDALLMSLRLD